MSRNRSSMVAAERLAAFIALGLVTVAVQSLPLFSAETPAELENKVRQLTNEIEEIQKELRRTEALLETIQSENIILREAPALPAADFADLDEAERSLVWDTIQSALAERNKWLWDGQRERRDGQPERLVSGYQARESEAVQLASSMQQLVNGSPRVLRIVQDFYGSNPDVEPSVLRMLFSWRLFHPWMVCIGLTFFALVIILHDRRVQVRKLLRPIANRLLTEYRMPSGKLSAAGILIAITLLGVSCSRGFNAAEESYREELEQQVRSLEETLTKLTERLKTEKARLAKVKEENHALFEKHLDAWTKHVAGNSADSESIRKKLQDAERDAQGRVRELALSASIARRALGEAEKTIKKAEETVGKVEEFRRAKEREDGRVNSARLFLYSAFTVLNLALITSWYVRRRREERRTFNTCPKCLSDKLTVKDTTLAAPGKREERPAECAECGYQMRPYYRQMTRLCLPTIGFRGSGKTSWLCMFHQSVLFGQSQAGLAHFGRATSLDESAANLDKTLEELFDRHDPTATTYDPSAVPPPLLYHFSDGDRFTPSGGVLNVFDFAGATMLPGGEGTKLQQRALHMDGFLYFLDPTGTLPPDHPVSAWNRKFGGQPGTPEEQNKVLQHFLEQVRIAHQIPVGKPVKVPVAICITKIDLMPRPDTNDVFRQFVEELQAISRDDPGPTLKTIRSRHELFLRYRESFFPGWGIEEQFDELFAGRFMFFPLTSVGFGELGEPDRTKRTIKPFGIIEPVLWLLHMNGYKVLTSQTVNETA